MCIHEGHVTGKEIVIHVLQCMHVCFYLRATISTPRLCCRLKYSLSRALYKMSDPPAKRPKVDNEEEREQIVSAAMKDDQNGLHYIKEGDVGITEYLNDYPGIFGILKRRFVWS